MVLCVVIMFFGIVGSTLSDDLTTKVSISSVVIKSQIVDYFASLHSTPATLLMLGFGLIGLAKFGRKMFKEYSAMKQKLSNDKDKRLGVDRRKFSFDFHIPERRSGMEQRNRFDRRLKTKNLRLIKTN